MAFQITSSEFSEGGEIAAQYTCDGDDIAPQLSWKDVPDGTASIALIVDDPDAPDPAAPKMVWAHWVLYNIPPSTTGLAEGTTSADLPEGTREGVNDWNETGYRGPCPPVGRHRYFHKLYALRTVLPDLGTPNKATLEDAMEGHILGQAELMGTYER